MQLSTQQSASTVLTSASQTSITQHKITLSELEKLKTSIGTFNSAQDYSQLVNGYGTGLTPPTEEEWASLAENTYIVESISFAGSSSSVDNSALPWFPAIGNQGGQGSCVAWSVGYYVKTFQEAKEHGWDISGASWIGGYSGHPTASYQSMIMSPAFVYNLINGGYDEGSSYYDAIELVCNIGECSWANMPYSYTDYTSWPSETAWTQAPFYRGNNSGIQYLYLSTDDDINDLKNYLTQENLAIISVDADQYDYLTSNDVWTLDNYVNPETNHANTIVGYDDNFEYTESGVTKHGAFKVANSWGTGYWENVNDGFYWISYEAMKQRVEYCMFYYDLTDYQPDLFAKFEISHTKRSECSITVGLGTPSNSIETKRFSDYVSGGSYSFCSNIIIMDITEFKDSESVKNQPFYLRVYDGGSTTTGTITHFSINSVNATGTPLATIQSRSVYLTLTYTGETAVTVTPNNGPGGGLVTLNGVDFSAYNSVTLSYLKPFNSSWVTISNSVPTTQTGQFTYSFNAPDIMQSNLAGDNPPQYSTIIFRVTDNGNGYSYNTTYAEWKRGLVQVETSTATGIYGNNTNLVSTVIIQVGQPFILAGKWFNPGTASVKCDQTTILQSLAIDETGVFNTSLTIPAIIQTGRHNITITDLNTDFIIKIAVIPGVANDYDGLWHSSDLTIHLTASDSSISTIYYRINGGQTKTVTADGQPIINDDGANNTLEYWGTWINGIFTIELDHVTLTNIKIDAASPQGFIIINNGETVTDSATVTLSLTATALSGISQVRFSNTGEWTYVQWENFSASKVWVLIGGDGQKTVYFQVKSNANRTATYFATITLENSIQNNAQFFLLETITSMQYLEFLSGSLLCVSLVFLVVLRKKHRL